MQTFKKILFPSIAFLLFLLIFSSVIIEPWIRSENTYYLDSKLREKLDGTIDCLVVGSSQGMTGFVPQIIDDELGTNSFNLSNVAMKMHGRLFMLQKELPLNPVDTVIIDISHDALTKENINNYGNGDAVTYARLGNAKDKISYLIKAIDCDDWLNIYSRNLMSGVVFWRDKIFGKGKNEVNYSAKGYHTQGTSDNCLKEEDIVSKYNASTIVKPIKDETLDELNEILELCRQKNCRVICVTLPVTDALLWENSDWDDFSRWITDYCKERGCEYYDFNLLKEKTGFLSDKTSFFDSTHLGDQGAKDFTCAFCSVIKKVNSGEDVSGLFYSGYEEMKQHSPYMEYYFSHVQ